MKIIFRYLVSEYIAKLAGVVSIAILVLTISNVFDALTRFRAIDVELGMLAQLVYLKIPYLISEISPILAMITSLLFVNHLLKSNQLANLFGSGFSILLIIKVVCAVNLIFAIIVLFVLSPGGSILLHKYEKLEQLINSGATNFVDNLLLKEDGIYGQQFIYIERLNKKDASITNPIVMILQERIFASRINCKSGLLKQGCWQLADCVIYQNGAQQKQEHYLLNSQIRIDDILDYIEPIYNVPFWRIPGIINTSEKLGMPTITLELYYYKQLLRPLLIMIIGLVPFYFFKADKKKIFHNIIDTFIVGTTSFLCINLAISFLANDISSAIIASVLPVICFIIFTFNRLQQTYKYPI
jgi:lipopolysaccharide export system permease protein